MGFYGQTGVSFVLITEEFADGFGDAQKDLVGMDVLKHLRNHDGTCTSDYPGRTLFLTRLTEGYFGVCKQGIVDALFNDLGIQHIRNGAKCQNGMLADLTVGVTNERQHFRYTKLTDDFRAQDGRRVLE